jgi:acyl carrier protein
MPDVELKVREAIRDHLGLAALPERSDNLRDDCGADSLDTVEMCLVMEEQFNIEIDDERLEKLETVGEWIDCVDELVKEGE